MAERESSVLLHLLKESTSKTQEGTVLLLIREGRHISSFVLTKERRKEQERTKHAELDLEHSHPQQCSISVSSIDSYTGVLFVSSRTPRTASPFSTCSLSHRLAALIHAHSRPALVSER